MLGWFLLSGACSTGAFAADRDAASPTVSARDSSTADRQDLPTVVSLGWLGALKPEQSVALRHLLEGELAGLKPARSLELHPASGAIGAWLDTARREPRTLLVALLEVQDSGTWRLYLVDTARARAIVRELPGEALGNSAALETVVSVVSSAVRALDEGLEIASLPVADVMGEPHLAAPDSVPTVRQRVPPSVQEMQLLGSVDGALSTFAPAAPVTLGVRASVRVQFPSGLLLRVSVLPNWPAHFASDVGSFEIQRTQAALAVGAHATRGPWQISGDIGPALEILRRRVLETQPEALSSSSTTLTRTGVELTLATRYRLSPRLALRLAVSGAYFPTQISYTLRPATERVLASPWRATGSVQLGLDFWLL